MLTCLYIEFEFNHVSLFLFRVKGFFFLLPLRYDRAIAKSDPIPSKVYISDLNPNAVDNIQHNITINNLSKNTEGLRMDWNDASTWPAEQVDVAVGSDLIYSKSLVPLLTDVIVKVTKPGGKFYYVCPDPESGPRDGLHEFISTMKKEVCRNDSSLWSEQPATSDLISNPLTSQDEEECFLHFQELSTLSFVLYEFQIPPMSSS